MPGLCTGPQLGHPSSTSGKGDGEPSGQREGNQLNPNSWLVSEPGPRMEGDCWCQGWGWSQQKAETSGLPHKKKKKKKKKEHQESRGPGPSHPHPLYEKVQNIITKKGSQRGP